MNDHKPEHPHKHAETSGIDHTIHNIMKQTPAQTPAPETTPDEGPGAKNLLIILLIVLVILGGIMAIRFFYTPSAPRGETVTYNNFEFEHKEGLWWSIWQNDNVQYILSLRYNPLETLNTTIRGTVAPTFARDTIYVSFDPRPESLTYVALSAAELSLNLAHALGVDVQAACTVNETEVCATKPILDCSSENVSVIILQDINVSSSISLNQDCITLSGNGLDLVRATDRLLYTFYGIIPHLHQE